MVNLWHGLLTKDNEMTVKQVIVVRKDLNMRKGKLAAQVAHASMKFFVDMSFRDESLEGDKEYFVVELNDDMKEWLNGAFTKVVVSVDSEEELLDIYGNAQDSGLLSSIIKDNGKTEFNGVPTYTAVAIGPDKSEAIDKITGHLKLL